MCIRDRFSGEALTWRLLVGGTLIMVAIVAAQLVGVHPDDNKPAPVGNRKTVPLAENQTGKTADFRHQKKVGVTL